MSCDNPWLGSLNPDIEICVGPVEFTRDPNRRVATQQRRTALGDWRLAWTRNLSAWPLWVWSIGMRWHTNETLAGVLYGDVFNFATNASSPPSEEQFLALFDHDEPDDPTAQFARVLARHRKFAEVFKDVNGVFGISAFAVDPSVPVSTHTNLIQAAARGLRSRFSRLRRAAIVIEAADFFGSQPILSPDRVVELPPSEQLRYREEVERRVALMSEVRFGEQFFPESPTTDTLLLQERSLE